MERFKTLSEKLINFYAHRYLISEDRLSWAVVYTEDDEGISVASPALKIKDSEYYININHDSIGIIQTNTDVYWFNIVDAWFSETDKNLRHGWSNGEIVSVDLDMETYQGFNSYNIPFDYDLEYKPEKSVKGTQEQIYSLDFFAYRNQINIKLLEWSVAELFRRDGHKLYLPVITIKGHKTIALYLERKCWVIDFNAKYSPFKKYYLHSAKLLEHTMQFTNSLGEEITLDLDMLCSMAEYQHYVELQIDKLISF